MLCALKQVIESPHEHRVNLIIGTSRNSSLEPTYLGTRSPLPAQTKPHRPLQLENSSSGSPRYPCNPNLQFRRISYEMTLISVKKVHPKSSYTGRSSNRPVNSLTKSLLLSVRSGRVSGEISLKSQLYRSPVNSQEDLRVHNPTTPSRPSNLQHRLRQSRKRRMTTRSSWPRQDLLAQRSVVEKPKTRRSSNLTCKKKSAKPLIKDQSDSQAP